MKVIAEYENFESVSKLAKEFQEIVKQYPEAYVEVEIDEDDDTFGDHHRTIKLVVWERW